MMQTHLVRLLIVVLLVACGFWVASATEWVEVDVPTPAKGEAKKNNLYVIAQVARGLGAEVTTATNLDTLPPPGATLLLTSWNWGMFPERADQLRQWVAQGGHLVMYRTSMGNDRLKSWLPIRDGLDDENDNEDDDEDENKAPDNKHPAVPLAKPAAAPECETLTEWDSLPASYTDGHRHFKLCKLDRYDSLLRAVPPAKVTWALNREQGTTMLRTAIDKGSVTVISQWGLLANDELLKDDDHILVAVSALQIHRGGQLWLVSEEARPHLVKWLWQHAWVVIALGLLALLLALWRGGVRFGPLAGIPANGRRSMAEQIVGTARFLRRSGAPSLLDAQWRALDDAGTACVRHYASKGVHDRAQAIAHATGLDAKDLLAAMDRNAPRLSNDLPSTLQLLETARRLLLQSSRSPKA